MTLASGLLVGGFGGVLYGGVVRVNPFVYANFLALFVLLAATTTASGEAALRGKIRNRSVALVLGLVIALGTLYCSWVGWLSAAGWLEAPSSAGLVTQPNQIWSLLQGALTLGAWEVFGFTPRGWFLALIWLLEALAMMVSIPLVTEIFLSEKPFCEACQVWTREELVRDLVPPEDPGVLCVSLESGDFSGLDSLQVCSTEGADRLRVKIFRCSEEACPDYLTLEIVSRQLKDDGDPQEECQTLSANLVVSERVREVLRSLSG